MLSIIMGSFDVELILELDEVLKLLLSSSILYLKFIFVTLANNYNNKYRNQVPKVFSFTSS